MVGKLVKQIYAYEQAELASGAKVTAQEVRTADKKVESIPNGNVNVENRSFNFSISNYDINGEKTYNLNNVPEGVDGQAIIKEFVDFVETDIA